MKRYGKATATAVNERLQKIARHYETVRPRRVSLIEFLQNIGGVQDEGGDLASMEIDSERRRFQRKLIQKKTGLATDKAREASAEAGYLPRGSTVADLLDLIDQEHQGSPVWSSSDEQAGAETFAELDHLKIEPSEISAIIRKGKGRRFNRIQMAVYSVVEVQVKDHLSTIAHKAWRTRLQLLEWGATSHPSDAARKSWDTRRKNEIDRRD